MLTERKDSGNLGRILGTRHQDTKEPSTRLMRERPESGSARTRSLGQAGGVARHGLAVGLARHRSPIKPYRTEMDGGAIEIVTPGLRCYEARTDPKP